MHPANHRRRRPLIALTLLATMAFLYAGQRKRPTDAAEGTSLMGAGGDPEPKPRLRIGTYNIHGGAGEDGVKDVSRAADYLRGCDLVGLNEVCGAPPFDSRGQAETIASNLRVPWLFAPTERRWWRDAFGNAVLTSLPVTLWQRIPISGPRAHSNRNMLLVRADWQQRPLSILLTHIEREDRESQLRTVIGKFLSLPEPCILMGDLNSPGDDPQIRDLLSNPNVVDSIHAALGKDDPERIDWIFARGMKAITGGMRPKGVSDHPFFWVDLELPPPPIAPR